MQVPGVGAVGKWGRGTGSMRHVCEGSYNLGCFNVGGTIGDGVSIGCIQSVMMLRGNLVVRKEMMVAWRE